MNANVLALVIAASLFAYASAFAAQPNGRDTVCATPGVTVPSAKLERFHAGSSRASVYAADLPAPEPKPAALGDVTFKPGRA
jgi:hypothetical protein